MRLFVSIDLSPAMKAALLDAQKRMRMLGVRGSFSPEENLHLTLAFIGEYPDAQEVLDALEEVRFDPFPITLCGCGCFGDLWWAGLENSDALSETARRVRHILSGHGIPFDRKRFSPHITLVRRAEGAKPVEIEPVSMVVREISLMRSDRGKRGMIYTKIR